MAQVSSDVVREPIQFGEWIRSCRIEVIEENGNWKTVANSTTVGCKRLHQIEPVVASSVRLVIEDAAAGVAVEELGLFFNPFQ